MWVMGHTCRFCFFVVRAGGTGAAAAGKPAVTAAGGAVAGPHRRMSAQE